MNNLFMLLYLCSTNELHTINIKEEHVKEQTCEKARFTYQKKIKSIALTDMEIDAITRVAWAEAGNQGMRGIIAVIFVILNRYISGGFGEGIINVINKKWAFEPVTKASGWNNLPKPSIIQRQNTSEIIAMITQGNLNDITNGSLYFQNPEIVKKRYTKKNKNLYHFNNSKPMAIIGDHHFYSKINGKNIKKSNINKNNHPVLIFDKKYDN